MTKPEIELSNLYIHLSIEAGTSYDGSFHIYSRNGQELSGKVLSTNDKIVVERKELSGTECEIPFYFKGKKSIAGEEHSGDFLLITNGGEVNIPYCVSIVPKKMRVQDKVLSTLAEFGRFAKEHWEKAKEVFFTKEFHDVFLTEKEELHGLYHDLLKGQSKDVILENFLMEALGKERPYVSIGEEELSFQEGKENVELILHGWGYLEGSLYGKRGNLQIPKEHFHIGDFDEDKKLILPVALKEGCWEDILVVETVYQSLEIPVKALAYTKSQPLSLEKRRKESFPVLLRSYVDFRTGKIGIEEYMKQSVTALKAPGHFYELYEYQILQLAQNSISEKKWDEAEKTEYPERIETGKWKEICEKLESKRSVYLRDTDCRSYYYYLMSFCKRDRASLLEASVQIKEQYEKTKDYRDYLLLTMVDRQVATDYVGQCEVLSEYMKKGEKSPLLYLALLDALEKEPYYLEKLVGIRSDLMYWAVKHQYLSLELSRQFAAMVLKEKYYSETHLKVLCKLYEVRKDDLYLKAICSLLIKGNKTEVSYHSYFQDAISKEWKLVGINEYYLRTLDFDTYPVLPKNLLYYFHYSNSLDKRERAYLYANVLQNREACGELLESYLIRMEEFAFEQWMEGRMNRYLCQLYAYFLPKMQERQEWIRYIPQIIFKKKLYCEHPRMEGVYVKQGGEEVYVPLVDGTCQVEIYGEDAQFYFVDDKRNRYHKEVRYHLTAYLKEEKFRELCLKYHGTNHKVRLRWLTKSVHDMQEYLEQADYQTVAPMYRRALMNYYIEQGRMEDAYFGAELYGSDLMEGNQLYLLTCVGLYLHKEEKDDLLLTMAHRSFLKKKYNKEVLLYLREHFEGRNFDLLALWEVLKREGLDTAEYEEATLNQLLMTGDREEQMLDILLSYLEKKDNDTLTESMLEIYSIYYFMGRKNMPESYFTILERQAKRENGLSFVSTLSYLLRKAEKGYELEERDHIRSLVEELSKKQMVFGFFDKFDTFVSIPPLWKEMTGFYYIGKEGETGQISLETSEKEGMIRRKNVRMEEVSPGFYYGKALLLPGEVVKERALFLGNQEIRDGIFQTKMKTKVKGSRWTILQQMEQEGTKEQLEQYDRVLGRMEEQLRILL